MPRPKASGRRWTTRFGGFVSSFTVPRLVAELGARGLPVTNDAAYGWVAGSFSPRPDVAHAIVQASGGSITMDDVFRHKHEVAHDGAGTNAGGVATGTTERDRR